ncbi:MAG: glycosyltransferase [Candidatus Bathyarchaeia archaeon]
MKKMTMRPWNLKITQGYQPSIAILVPAYNEAKLIRLKLQNLKKIDYPSDKMNIVIINDASTDNTLNEIETFKAQNPVLKLKIKVINNKEHAGKINCLNQALKLVIDDLVIISDADCFWPSDLLQKALKYLSDPSVGAVTARELLLNTHDSWVTRGEQFYNKTVQTIRIGESKIHSTIFFQGGFAAYKRNLLQEFNHEIDDSGTALDIVQKNKRALLLPEIGFYTIFPSTWKNKVTLKLRRASHLQHLLAKCGAMLLDGKLLLPKRIAIPEIFLHFFSPLFFIALAVLSALVFTQYPLLFLVFLFFFGLLLCIEPARIIMLETLQSNLILLAALFFFVFGKRYILWINIQESRILLTEELLNTRHLI